MKKTITLEHYKEIAKSKGGKCLSTKYNNQYTKLKFKCKKDHIWTTSATSIMYLKSWCPTCSTKRISESQKLTYEEVKNKIESIGFKLLSKEYINNRTKLDIKCNEGHKFSRVFYSLFVKKEHHNGCPVCYSLTKSSSRKLGIEKVRQLAEKIGLKLLSKEYKNNMTKMEFQCKQGHISYKRTYQLVKEKQGCRKCYNIKLRTNHLPKYKKLIESKGGELIERKLKDRRTHLIIKCKNAHTFRISSQHLTSRDSWCRKCFLQDGESKCEKTARAVFEKIYGAKFPNVRPDWLINPSTGKRLELDLYNEDLKIAAEYNGEQHYNYITYFHSKRKTFENLQKTDKLKKKICAERGVKLIVIPYTETGADIEKFIKKQSIAINLIR